MNTESIDCRRVQFGEMERPGDFTFSEEFDTIYVWLPGINAPDAIRIQKGPPGGDRVWGWDGNEVFPTLEPSIHCPGTWHGYLKQGKLVSC
jgi:hypothetical protein